MPEIVVIRHGETAWSRSGQHTGTTDMPLLADGEEQAASLAAALSGRSFGLALSSPRQRARRTAELAGIASVELDDNLGEWDYGAYEGLTTPQISTKLGRPWFLWEDGVPAGATPGETIDQVAARTAAVLDRARPVLAAGSDVVLIAHSHLLRVLAAVWLELPPTAGSKLVVAPASIGTLGYDHDRPVLRSWNTHPPS